MKSNFSEPKIYTGGIEISKWSKLSRAEQNNALAKDWYVYFSFRDPKTGKLQRQNNIKAGVNRFKTKRQRLAHLQVLQQSLLLLLNKGFNPYKDNTELENSLLNHPTKIISHVDSQLQENQVTISHNIDPIVNCSIREAFILGMDIKRSVLSKTSFPSFSSNVNRFENWLYQTAFKPTDDIVLVTKKHVLTYLNEVLQKTSPRTRNNTRIDLSSLFQTLEDNDLISENVVKKISVLKATPERNKTYTPTIQNDIFDYMSTNDKTLLLFVKFISYNYLRPIEVCRLRVEDLDLRDRKLYVRAKNSPVKAKIIPEILLNDLPDLSAANRNHFLFTPNGICGEWGISENDKRDYFSKRFKKVKDYFNLGKDYGLYSFRHTFITKLYNEFAKTLTPNEAKSRLMLITGHTSMTALDKYLRDIDAVLPDDYSEYL